MKNRFDLIVLLALMVLSFSLVTGCGQQSSETTTTSTVTTTITTTTTSTSTTTTTRAPGTYFVFGALNLAGPTYVAVDPAGYVYVSSSDMVGGHYVSKFDTDGNWLFDFGSPGTGEGQFNYPYGIAVTSNHHVYVVDGGNARVQKFTSSGSYEGQFGIHGFTDLDFNQPTGIVIDQNGKILVSDISEWGSPYHARVTVRSSNEVYLTYFGSPELVNPCAVATDANGNIYVLDASRYLVCKYSNAGTLLMQFGANGTGEGQFVDPYGVAVDQNGNIYVTDYLQYNVQKFNRYGTYEAKVGVHGGGASSAESITFDGPYGIAVDANGDLYVVDSALNDRVHFIPASTFH